MLNTEIDTPMNDFIFVGTFKEDLEKMLDPYCESLSDQEFEWLVAGVTGKLKDYIVRRMQLL